MTDYQKLAEENAPCIIVCPRYQYDRDGRRINDGFTVIAESKPKLGHSLGKGTRYDYGFMQVDAAIGINVFVMP